MRQAYARAPNDPQKDQCNSDASEGSIAIAGGFPSMRSACRLERSNDPSRARRQKKAKTNTTFFVANPRCQPTLPFLKHEKITHRHGIPIRALPCPAPPSLQRSTKNKNNLFRHILYTTASFFLWSTPPSPSLPPEQKKKKQLWRHSSHTIRHIRHLKHRN